MFVPGFIPPLFILGGPNRLDLFYSSYLIWSSRSYYLTERNQSKGLLYVSKMTVKINLNMRNDSLFHGCSVCLDNKDKIYIKIIH